MRFSFKRESYKATHDAQLPSFAKTIIIEGLPVMRYAMPFGNIWLQVANGIVSETRLYHISITNRFTLDFDAPGSIYVCIILNGDFSFSYGNIAYKLSSGECWFTYVTKQAKSMIVDTCCCTMIHFSVTKSTFNSFLANVPALNEKLLTQKKHRSSFLHLPLGAVANHVQHIIRDICHSLIKQANSQIFLEARKYELLMSLANAVRESQQVSLSSVYHKQLERVRLFIENNLDEELLLRTLARQFGFSSTQLRKLFRVAYQQSIGRFILEKRMQSAFYLLSKTSLSIQEIALRVGYLYTSSFCRAFKSVYKLTPLELRRNAVK